MFVTILLNFFDASGGIHTVFGSDTLLRASDQSPDRILGSSWELDFESFSCREKGSGKTGKGAGVQRGSSRSISGKKRLWLTGYIMRKVND